MRIEICQLPNRPSPTLRLVVPQFSVGLAAQRQLRQKRARESENSRACVRDELREQESKVNTAAVYYSLANQTTDTRPTQHNTHARKWQLRDACVCVLLNTHVVVRRARRVLDVCVVCVVSCCRVGYGQYHRIFIMCNYLVGKQAQHSLCLLLVSAAAACCISEVLPLPYLRTGALHSIRRTGRRRA